MRLTRSASFGVTLVLVALLLGCGRAAVAQNGAFDAGDGCDQLVLEAMGRHSELRWIQQHSDVGPNESIDTALGYGPGENRHPTRQWTRYRRSTHTQGRGMKDVLTGVVWEINRITNERKPRTDYMSLKCGRAS